MNGYLQLSTKNSYMLMQSWAIFFLSMAVEKKIKFMKDNETHLTFSISYHFLDHEQGHPRLRFEQLDCKSASSVIVRFLGPKHTQAPKS